MIVHQPLLVRRGCSLPPASLRSSEVSTCASPSSSFLLLSLIPCSLFPIGSLVANHWDWSHGRCRRRVEVVCYLVKPLPLKFHRRSHFPFWSLCSTYYRSCCWPKSVQRTKQKDQCCLPSSCVRSAPLSSSRMAKMRLLPCYVSVFPIRVEICWI